MVVKLPRIGVFGGAFDPPHNAHVALARAAVAQLDLIELRIFPTGEAWHKERALNSAQDRLAMAQLAFGDLPQTVVDAREMLRPGPTYTLDTLRELHAERPGAQLVLVMGADQAGSLIHWHGWQDIVGLAAIAVAWRPATSGSASPSAPRILPSPPPGVRFESIELEPTDTSATQVRQRAARGEDLGALVPPAVARYIDQHHLYRPT
ncbi:putative nicotinate-nucleotide adenylyltransferase [Burkholderiales bacterium 8X]|nr:putative nicotinate-nucleotide adenylyltransferase [Burkholderiales bacterium 8X]